MIERKNIDPTGILRRREEEEERYEAGQRFLEENADDAAEYADDEALINELRGRGYKVDDKPLGIPELREALEAKGFHIATRDEQAWLNKPLTGHDKQLINWAETLTDAEWTKIRSEEADTYQGWKALKDITNRLHHYEEASAGIG